MYRRLVAVVAAFIALLIVGTSLVQASGDGFAGALLGGSDTGGVTATDPASGPPITPPGPPITPPGPPAVLPDTAPGGPPSLTPPGVIPTEKPTPTNPVTVPTGPPISLPNPK
jgi:hypothetical protein